jgi:phosphate transport system permease protein
MPARPPCANSQSPSRFHPPRSGGARAAPVRAGKPRRVEALIEFLIRSSGFVVIGSVLLIFVFVGKEAIPLLTSKEVHKEVTVGRMIAPQEGGGYSWQPVSIVPKYSLLPLLIGTLKVTLVALVIALPIAVGAATAVTSCRRKPRRSSSTRWRACST